MDKIIGYNFYVRIGANSVTADLHPWYNFNDLVTRLKAVVPSGISPNWQTSARLIAGKFLRLDDSESLSNPNMLFIRMKAANDEDLASQWTSIYLSTAFNGLPAQQMLDMPNDSKIFKDYFIWFLGWKSEFENWNDIIVSGTVFLLERGKNSIKSEMERILKEAYSWQRCELRKIVTKKRMVEIANEMKALKYVWKIRSNWRFGPFTNFGGANVEILVKLPNFRLLDFKHWNDAIKEFMEDTGRKGQIIMSTNWAQSTVTPVIDPDDEQWEQYLVEIDASILTLAFIWWLDFKNACSSHISITRALTAN